MFCCACRRFCSRGSGMLAPSESKYTKCKRAPPILSLMCPEPPLSSLPGTCSMFASSWLPHAGWFKPWLHLFTIAETAITTHKLDECPFRVGTKPCAPYTQDLAFRSSAVSPKNRSPTTDHVRPWRNARKVSR